MNPNIPEPDDKSAEEMAREAWEENKYQEFLESGWLPNGDDPAIVDAKVEDRMPGFLHDLHNAYNQLFGSREALASIARDVAETREEIVREIIKEMGDE